MAKKQIEKSFLGRQLSGVWHQRNDLKSIGQTLRKLRKGIRLIRFGLG